MPEPAVYDHTDYRTFVRAWLAAHPKRSQSWLAKQIGVGPAMMSMVLSGERDLGLHLGRTLGSTLGLEDDDLTYFDALVRAAHGPTLAIRRAALHHVRAARDFVQLRQPSPEQFSWFGSWIHLAILGLARFDGFRPEATWIARRLWPEVDEDVVKVALVDLLRAGVLTEAEGAWRVDQRPLGTGRRIHDRELSVAARRLHLDQLDHAALALETFGADERFTASVSIAISRDQLPDLIAALHRFHLEVIEPFREGPPEQLVEVVVALFPRSRTP